MLFFQGGYGGFNARSLVAGSGTGLRRQLQSAELARGPMEALAEEAGIPCYAQVVVDGDLLVVAAAGPQGQSVGTHIGSRLPLQPPYGSLFCVGEDLPAAVRRWTANIGKVADDERETLRSVLETVRGRGWSVGLVAPRHEEIWQEVGRLADMAPTPANDARLAELLTPLRAYYDPREFPDQPVDLRILAAPVVVDGATTMVVALHGFTEPLSVDALAPYLAALDRTASRIGDRISQRMDAAVS
jgi:hypothetical protein